MTLALFGARTRRRQFNLMYAMRNVQQMVELTSRGQESIESQRIQWQAGYNLSYR